MNTNDTVRLLEQCNSGIKMGVDTIEGTMPNVQSGKLRSILLKSKNEHQSLGSQTHELLNSIGLPYNEPSATAKTMSWIKTNFNLFADSSDSTVAELITDGCNMGIKSLNKYLNDYPNAKPESIDIAHDLINLEKKLALDVSPYLSL